MAARMKEKYTTEIAPALLKKFGYKSVMQIPKLDKIIVNVGCGIRGTVTRGPLQVLLGDLEMCGGRTAHGEKIREIALGTGVTQLNFKGQSGKGNDNGKFLPSVVKMWRLKW